MAHRIRSSDLVDPLQVYSGLSLFPRTLKSLSKPLPSPRMYQSDDLQQTHSLLESMPLKCQSKLLEQAKAILDGNSELQNPRIPVNVVSEDENQGIEMNPITNQRERRQGLGRKRARFSLKPTTSQPNPNFEPSFDDSKYQNPEDFFAAYEKFENAKREWQKQTGTSLTNTHQNQPAIRPRRPGISGRRQVSYNHRYSTDAVYLDASVEEIISPSEQSSLKNKTANVTTVDREFTDPTIETEKNVDNILGELLSCTEELVGDVNHLEERLQIKPIDTEKLSLPELQDVRKSEFLASRKNSSKPRTVLSDIQNMLKGIHSETARKNSQTPSPLQSPEDSHKEHLSPSSLQDQFSFPDTNHLLPGDIPSSDVDMAKDSNIYSRSLTAIDVYDDIDNEFPSNVGSGDVSGLINKTVEKTSSEVESDIHTDNNLVRSKRTVDVQAEGNDGDIPISESETYRDMDGSGNDSDICASESNQLNGLAAESFRGATKRDGFTVDKDVISSQQDESPKSEIGVQEQYNTGNGSSEYAENLQEQHGKHNGPQDNDAQDRQTSKREKRRSRERKMAYAESERRSHERKRSKIASCENGTTEETEREIDERKENEQRKRVSRESKAFARRKSLAAAGTKWESGVRKSTRIKSRPLEYWKGERFLYGRIHGSLATVIGIKYESPSKKEGEERKLKVKSYVSEEYNKLVEQAALH